MLRINIFVLFLISLFIFSGCGFKPIYKKSDTEVDLASYKVVIENESSISRGIIEKIKETFGSPKDYSHIVSLNINESQDPLIINSNGTISKYRIEILINYVLSDNENDKILREDIGRGYAQYDVQESEITNIEKKKAMIKSATNEALQIMLSKIQGTLSRNDN